MIRAVAERPDPAVFVLWGNYAKKKLPLIDTERHAIVQGAHPSPLSAKLFLGSRPFTQIDEAIRTADLRGLMRWLNDQPSWSDFPIVLLTHPGLAGCHEHRGLLRRLRDMA